jgi:hypothetical protein
MLKSKLIVVLSLLFVLSLDGVVLAEKTNSSPALNPDGIPAAGQQHKRRRARRKQRIRRAGSYGIKAMPEQPSSPPPETNTGAAPEPPTPAAEEMPVKAAPPPPQASPEMAAPGQGAPKKSAPRIKPPTVQIKPPTK